MDARQQQQQRSNLECYSPACSPISPAEPGEEAKFKWADDPVHWPWDSPEKAQKSTFLPANSEIKETNERIDEQINDVIAELNELAQLCAGSVEMDITNEGQVLTDQNDTSTSQNDSNMAGSDSSQLLTMPKNDPLLPNPLSNEEIQVLASLGFESKLPLAVTEGDSVLLSPTTDPLLPDPGCDMETREQASPHLHKVTPLTVDSGETGLQLQTQDPLLPGPIYSTEMLDLAAGDSEKASMVTFEKDISTPLPELTSELLSSTEVQDMFDFGLESFQDFWENFMETANVSETEVVSAMIGRGSPEPGPSSSADHHRPSSSADHHRPSSSADHHRPSKKRPKDARKTRARSPQDARKTSKRRTQDTRKTSKRRTQDTHMHPRDAHIRPHDAHIRPHDAHKPPT